MTAASDDSGILVSRSRADTATGLVDHMQQMLPEHSYEVAAAVARAQLLAVARRARRARA